MPTPLGAYRYLRGGPDRSPADVAEVVHGAGLRQRATVWDEKERSYLVFASWRDYWAWQRAVPGPHSHHEVIFGSEPQRLKFDIDATGPQLLAASELSDSGGDGGQSEVAKLLGLLGGEAAVEGAEEASRAGRFMRLFLALVLDELHAAYHLSDGVFATRDDLAVMDSSGPVGGGGVKYSFHVVVAAPWCVANSEEAKGFTARVLAQLPPGLRPLVDPQVNKTLQNFRLTGSAKPGSCRVKRVSGEFGTGLYPDEETRVGAPAGSRVLTRLCTEASEQGDRLLEKADGRARAPPLEAEDREAVLEVARAAGALAGHRFLRDTDGLFLFRRVAPSHCCLCGRDHAHDNTLMLRLAPPCQSCGGKELRAVEERCRHLPAAKRRLGEAWVAEGSAGGRGAESRLAAVLKKPPPRPPCCFSETLPAARQEIYSAPEMRPYAAVPTLAVRAQMGVGKSRALRAYLDREYAAPLAASWPPVLRFLTFRKTFSRAAQRALFSDFALYSDHSGDLDHLRYPRLLVQIESLHRLPMGEAPEPISLLILDEVESLIAQLSSGLHRHFAASFAMFEWLVKTAERVVALDANLGEPTLTLLQRLRGGELWLHWNQHAAAAGDTHRFTSNLGVWLGHLYARLQGGERAAVATNSLAEAETLDAEIRQRFPEKKVALYSSKTSQALKDAHFADLDLHWGGLDVLLYTPTVSAGVSYEGARFDVFFGHFTDASCPVETCRQMLGRVRAVKTREYLLYLAERPGGRHPPLPTTVAEIRRQLKDKRTGLYRRLQADGLTGLQFSYEAGGGVVFPETPYFHLWLETARVIHLSRNQFVDRFVAQVAATQATVAPLLPLAESAEPKGLQACHRKARQALAAAENAEVAGAAELGAAGAASVRERLERQLEVSLPERRAYERWKLAETYRWHGRPMDAAFVAAYRAPSALRVFRSLRRVAGARSLYEALLAIQGQEAEARLACLSPEGPSETVAAGECRDLQTQYVFRGHFLATWLLFLVGFRCLTDPARLHAREVVNRLRTGKEALASHLGALAEEFELRCPHPSQLFLGDSAAVARQGLSLVNGGLRRMYGREVRHPPSDREFYVLELSPTGRLFALTPESDAPPPDRPSLLCRLVPSKKRGEAAAIEFMLAQAYGGRDVESDA